MQGTAEDDGKYMELAFLLSYLIGSIPFGLLLTKAAGLGDIRAIGSGNIGATNVLRTGNKKLAALTLLLDGGKGALAVWLAKNYIPNTFALMDSRLRDNDLDFYSLLTPAYIAYLGVVIGHIFPLWLKFKGGKGVATALGGMFALVPGIGWIVTAVWLVIFLCCRYSSLAAIIAIGLSPILALEGNDASVGAAHYYTGLALYLALAAVLIIYRHKDNIRRLLSGTEHKFTSRSSKGDAA